MIDSQKLPFQILVIFSYFFLLPSVSAEIWKPRDFCGQKVSDKGDINLGFANRKPIYGITPV